jgi:hypothetical protein
MRFEIHLFDRKSRMPCGTHEKTKETLESIVSKATCHARSRALLDPPSTPGYNKLLFPIRSVAPKKISDAETRKEKLVEVHPHQ